MKVAELKQVVDANAVEMREGFAKVEDDFIDMRREMRAGFALMERRIQASQTELSRQMDNVMEHLMDRVAVVAEATVEAQIDRKIAASEVRMTRKFGKR